MTDHTDRRLAQVLADDDERTEPHSTATRGVGVSPERLQALASGQARPTEAEVETLGRMLR